MASETRTHSFKRGMAQALSYYQTDEDRARARDDFERAYLQCAHDIESFDGIDPDEFSLILRQMVMSRPIERRLAQMQMEEIA